MEKQKAKIIKASKALQSKAGQGDISAEAITKAEIAIKDNTRDFMPLAENLLIQLSNNIENVRRGGSDDKTLIKGLSKPVMELKSNAKMFGYDLVTNLANIMLDFLESIESPDALAVDIVEAHHKTLSLILAKKMSGDGGAMGPVLQKELQAAIQRYFVQKKKAN